MRQPPFSPPPAQPTAPRPRQPSLWLALRWSALLSRWIPRVGGVALLGVAAMALPFPVQHLAQFEALNRELGKLCANPPRQAQTVCRLHARLVSSL
jgi:hypothetical protein